MSQVFTHPDQVRGFFQFLAVELEERHGFDKTFLEMHLHSLQFIAEKNRDYRGKAYLEQIEKNAIYLGEAFDATSHAMANFLRDGKPRLQPGKIPGYVLQLRGPALDASEYHLNYVRNGCRRCPVHDRHQRWSALYRLKRADDIPKYIEELEFTCIVYQMQFVMAQAFLEIILQNHQWANITKDLSIATVHQILSVELETRASMWSGLIKPSQTPIRDSNGTIIGWEKQAVTQKQSWHEIWGEEYDQIVDAMQR